MCTSRPGETLSPFFDKYVHKQTPLKEFLDKYELALHKKHKEESLADIESRASDPPLKTRCSFELQAIPSKYVLFRWRKDYKRIIHVPDDGDTSDGARLFSQLHRSALKVVEEGVVSVEHYGAALQAFEESLNKVHEVEEQQEQITSVE
ncbi:Protein FAR1-RELATED SEQUENCE 6 [Linum perenne]